MAKKPTPVPVSIESPKPLPVTVTTTETTPKPSITTEHAAVVEPKTTAEEDRKTRGQRNVNLIWEFTQAAIANFVTLCTLYVAAILALKDDGTTAAFLLLSNAFFLVIGFYFGRTNHQRTGGIGGDSAGTR